MNKINLTSTKKVFLLYAIFTLYETLLPFNLSCKPLLRFKDINWYPFFTNCGSPTSIADIFQNILLFIPFGYLSWIAVQTGKSGKLLTGIFTSLIFSSTIEVLQLFTIDRTTSTTDILSNTLGGLLGSLIAKHSAMVWYRNRNFLQLRNMLYNKHFFPIIFTSFILLVEQTQPFDFSMERSFVLPKFHYFLESFAHVTFTCDDTVFLLFIYALLSFQVFHLTVHLNIKRKVQIVFIALTALCLFIELTQFIVGSQIPAPAHIITAFAGITTGVFCSFTKNSFLHKALLVMGFTASFLCKLFAPCTPGALHNSIKHCSYAAGSALSTISGISNAIETAIMYYCGGYIVSKVTPVIRAYPVKTLFISIIIVIGLEYLQEMTVNETPAIFDIILAVLCFRWGIFFGFVREKALNQSISACE